MSTLIGLGTSITAGIINEGDNVEIICEQENGAVVFGDGIEDDRIEPRWGQRLEVSVAERRLRIAVDIG